MRHYRILQRLLSCRKRAMPVVPGECCSNRYADKENDDSEARDERRPFERIAQHLDPVQ
jgi:hypothetical protein